MEAFDTIELERNPELSQKYQISKNNIMKEIIEFEEKKKLSGIKNSFERCHKH